MMVVNPTDGPTFIKFIPQTLEIEKRPRPDPCPMAYLLENGYGTDTEEPGVVASFHGG